MLVLSILILSFSETYAQSSYNKSEENDYINNIMALAKEFYPNIEPEIERVTSIYIESDICEVAVDISYNNTCYGYVVIDYPSMNISQFMIKENAQGFCMEYFNRLPESEEKIVKVDMLNYEIVGNTTINYLSNRYYDDLFDIFLHDFPEPMYNNFTMSCKTIGRFCRIGEDKIVALGGKYCCAVVAMLNVCGAYGLFNKTKDDQIYSAYKKLWGYSDIKQVGTEDPEYGMDEEKMGKVLSKYYKDVTRKDIPYKNEKNPSLDFFIDAVDKKYASILGVYTTCENEKCGHAVSVEGYFVFEPLNEIVYGERQVFLYVADGWSDDPKYIWYDKVNVESTYGVVFRLYK